jgi:glyoxylase-like metal-dependent hydrolase (beta-lactamase superfamily II)
MPFAHRLCTLLAFGFAGCSSRDGTRTPVATVPPTSTVVAPVAATENWCAKLPRPGNAALPIVHTSSPWFHVYQAAPNVFALIETDQFQEAISYLIVGTTSAVLFDTGIGVLPIRPVAEELTRLPIVVVNSHSHYDHVGGNAEFDRVLTMNTPFTRVKMAGRPHAGLASEVAPASFCHGAPTGLDTAAFRSKPWKSAGFVKDGDQISLGGRTLEVLSVPGHTPDALALLDRANGLLFTGDTFYDGTIWLFAPETNLDDYVASMERLVALGPVVTQLLPAHNTAKLSPSRLAVTLAAAKKLRAGTAEGHDNGRGEITFDVDGVQFLSSRAAIAAAHRGR